MATLFVWNIETIVVAVGPRRDSFVGLSSIWIDASRLASIVTWPSSASMISGAFSRMIMLPSPVTGLPTITADCDTITGRPKNCRRSC
jgi:hypothetical protein